MDQEKALSDQMLMSLYQSDDDLSVLTPAERQRLLVLTAPKSDGGPRESSVMDERGMIDKAVDYLPAALSTGMGFLGGTKRTAPGAALAGLGGAGGEGLRQTVRAMQGRTDEYPDTAAGQLRRMGESGAVGATTELGGRAVIGGLKRLAPSFMRSAFGAQTQVRKAFPDVDLERAALDARAIPGSARSMNAVQQAGQQGAATLRNDLKVIDIASGNAPVASYADAVSVLRRRAPDARMAARGGAPAELNAVKDGLRQVRDMRGRPLNAEETFVSKQAHQKAGAAAQRSQAGAEAEAGAEVSSDVGRGLVAALRAKHPEIAAQLDSQQGLMALERAMANAQTRGPLLRMILGNTAGAGAGAMTYGATGDVATSLVAGAAVPAATHLLTSPASLARMGITSDVASRAMQSAGARIPDALLRKQLLELLSGKYQGQE